jgi:hypothetical protein
MNRPSPAALPHAAPREQAAAPDGPGFTACEGDPFAARRRREAVTMLHAVTRLADAIGTYQKWLIERSATGRRYTDEDHAEIAVCEAFQRVQYTDELHGIIAGLKRDLGLDGEDAQDLFGHPPASRAARIAAAAFDGGKG